MGDETSSRETRRPGQDRLIGRVLATRFELLELLTRGAMGKIYRAHQTDLGRECAIKVLDIRYVPDASEEFTARFFREASLAAKLSHPNVVTVFDYGRTEDDVYFIAMELLRGKTLAKLLNQERRLPWQRAIDIATQLCRGLRVAHGEDVVHRDLKPANIFLVDTGDGELVKIVDFGLAKVMNPDAKEEQLTQIGAFMGSARYACPEQIRGTDIDGRADIYAVGIILYEMITGQVPFDGPNEAAVLVAHMRAQPKRFHEVAPDVDVPEELERVIFKAFAHKREDRFASAAELLQALKSASGLSALLVTANNGLPRAKPVSETTTGSGFTLAPFEATANLPRLSARPTPKRVLWFGGGALAMTLLIASVLVVRCAAGPSSAASEEDETSGHVAVTVSGGACKVAVDGVAQGASPVAPVAVHPGMHTVTCTRTDGRVLSTQVRVDARESASARFVGD